MKKLSPLILSLICSTAIAQDNVVMDGIIVTATKEKKEISKTADTIRPINEDQIRFTAPTHPSEILEKVSGVHINNLGGEGHMTAIRQPISTSGNYLFLEDGVPTRPTGMFNHNGLYEINIPQAQSIEITKGPGTALYGSESVGGIINVLTKPSPKKAEIEFSPEVGSYGWKRALLSGGAPIGKNHGYRLNINSSENEGYREESKYSRLSTTARFDGYMGDKTSYKAILSHTKVDQSGVSSLEEDDYKNNPTENFYHNDVARREVDALRVSSEFNYEPNGKDLISVTPFYRKNNMKLMPSWMMSYDPNDRDYNFHSVGLLLKHRRKVSSKFEFISGVDYDHSPITYKEIRISKTSEADGTITSTAPTGRVNYDYDAVQTSISPYIHTEWVSSPKWRFLTGVRYDYFKVNYTDNLDSSVAESVSFNKHYRPDSQEIKFNHLSPKFGVVHTINEKYNSYFNIKHSFRVPSVGTLFRSGSNLGTDKLKPTRVQSYEIGFRGRPSSKLSYSVALYSMVKKDEVVTYIEGSDRKVTNAGETVHNGIEIDLSTQFNKAWSLSTAVTYTEQTYGNFQAKSLNYEGNDIAKAPATIANITLTHRTAKVRTELEVSHIGKYYTDETNTQEYDGHNLLNIRSSYAVSKKYQMQLKVHNILNEKFSTLTSNSVGSSDLDYRPGMPTTVYMGLTAKF